MEGDTSIMSTRSPSQFKSVAGTPQRLFEFAGRFSVLIDDALRMYRADTEWIPLLFLQLADDELALSAIPKEHFEDDVAINDFYANYLPDVLANSGAALAALACGVWAIPPDEHDGSSVMNNTKRREAIVCVAASANETIGTTAFIDRTTGPNLSISRWMSGVSDNQTAAALRAALRRGA
jgi:hypothetical protein